MVLKRIILLILSILFFVSCGEVANEVVIPDNIAMYNLQDVSRDQAEVLGTIYTEGKTVVIYGRSIDIFSLKEQFYAANNVRGVYDDYASNQRHVCYMCISTCLNNIVYVTFVTCAYTESVEIDNILDMYLDEQKILEKAIQFRENILNEYNIISDTTYGTIK